MAKKYIDAERLKAEIEKRLKNVRDYMNGAGMKYRGPKYFKAQGKESAYDALLNTIDSLSEEPSKGLDVTDFCKPIDPGIAQCVADHWWEMMDEEPDKSLEEAAAKHIRKVVDAAGHPGWDWTTQDITEAFIAGAKLQKEQDTRDMFMSDNRHFDKVYELGKKDMKEQMMKDAVEGKVFMSFAPGHNQMVMADVDLPTNTKVKLIIVKEDEK